MLHDTTGMWPEEPKRVWRMTDYPVATESCHQMPSDDSCKGGTISTFLFCFLSNCLFGGKYFNLHLFIMELNLQFDGSYRSIHAFPESSKRSLVKGNEIS